MGLPLVTLEGYKAYAGISSTNQDDIINSLIVTVSALVKTICRRTFVDYIDDFKVEYFEGGDSFELEEYPILNVVSVEWSSDYGNTYNDLTQYTDYVPDSRRSRILPIPNPYPIPGTYDVKLPVGMDSYTRRPYFNFGINAFRVTYSAGFDQGIPDDLCLGIYDLMTYYIKNDMSIHANKAPGSNKVQIEYITTTALPSHIKRVLDYYTASYN